MAYYREPSSYHNGNYILDSEKDFNQASMFGDILEKKNKDNGLDYDPEYDEEVNQLLEQFEEELNEDSTELNVKKEKIVLTNKDQYEDFYDEFPPEEAAKEIPLWYKKTLQEKQRITTDRLKSLSKLVSYASPKAWEHVKRIEQDHHTPFCKLNPPRYPPPNRPWQNYWKFNCVTRCTADPLDSYHAHTSDCEEIVLEHIGTNISTKSKSIFRNEFPEHVMRTVELFQKFVNDTAKDNPYLHPDVVCDTVYEKPTWSFIKLRTNYKNEIMMIASGKGLTPLLDKLKKIFEKGEGRTLNVISLWCVNARWSQKKSKFPPTHLYGFFELRDKVGPITLKYSAQNNMSFNSAEAEQLGRIMMEYLNPTSETTVIDIGCNFGVLSLMLATKTDKVIGLTTLDHEVQLAEKIKEDNKVNNASFIVCTQKEVHTKCSPFVKKSITVAVLNLSSHFGKSPDVMRALRNLPTVWRIAIYGSFKSEFQKYITILTSSDHLMGDEFLPMQGCILERSPSISDEFNIVTVLERKSLIEPRVDLIANGPTVNIKEDLDNKPVKPVRIPGIKTSELVSRGYGKFRQFDSPSLPKPNKDVKPVIKSQLSESSSLLPEDYGKPVPKQPTIDIAQLYNSTPNPKINRQLKRIFDSPLLPKSSDTTNSDPKKNYNNPSSNSSIENEASNSTTISTDPRCDFLSKSRPPLPTSTESRSSSSASKPPIPISTDPRCDFLNDIMPLNVNTEPFDQKKVLIYRKDKRDKRERNFVGPSKPTKKQGRSFDCPSLFVKKENQNSTWSTSSQDSNSKSPPPFKKEQILTEAPSRSLPTGRAFEVISTLKTTTINSAYPAKAEAFSNPPMPKGLPSEYAVLPQPNYITPPCYNLPPPGFNIPPPGFNVPPPGFNIPLPGFMVPPPSFNIPLQVFNIPPPIPKKDCPLPSTEREEGELSPENTENSLLAKNTENSLLDKNTENSLFTKKVPDISNQPDILLDAIVKSEPMDLDEDDQDEKNLPGNQMKSSSFVKSEKVTQNQETTETFPTVRIKSEPIESSEKVEGSAELPKFNNLSTQIKTEPADSDELVTASITTPLSCVKQEKVSPILNAEDLMSMPTPIHNPVALAERNRQSVSPPPVSANFQTIDGLEFSVKPNQSYLTGVVNNTVKKESELDEGEWGNETPKSQQYESEPVIEVKLERSFETETRPPVVRIQESKPTATIDSYNQEDDEIEIITEKKPKKAKKEKKEKKDKSKKSSRKKGIKKERETSREPDLRRILAKLSEPDIRILLEEKRKIKKMLNGSSDNKEHYASASSTNWDRRLSPPSAYKYEDRSSPSRYEKWARRSSSPSRRYPSRSPSPRERWSRRSPASPSTSRPWKRSPSSSSYSRYRRSPSSFSKFKRSPSSSSRYLRRSPSPYSNKKFRRSPTSFSSRRFQRASPSASERRFERSISPSDGRFRHSSLGDMRFKQSPASPTFRYVRPPPSPNSNSFHGRRRYQQSVSPETNSFYDCRAKLSSARKYDNSPDDDYESIIKSYKAMRKSLQDDLPFEKPECKAKKPSLSAKDSVQRKSPHSEGSETKEKESEDKTNELWNIKAMSDLSSVSDICSPERSKQINRVDSPTGSVSC